MMLNYTEMMREDLLSAQSERHQAERQSAALRDIVAFINKRVLDGTYEYSDMQHIKSVAQDALKGGA